jgi:hypothetical protein
MKQWGGRERRKRAKESKRGEEDRGGRQMRKREKERKRRKEDIGRRE